jgi:hypothetical protein
VSGGEESTRGGEVGPVTEVPAPTPVELHPRKRKLKPKEQPVLTEPHSEPPQPTSIDQQVTNCYQLFLNIRKQVLHLPSFFLSSGVSQLFWPKLWLIHYDNKNSGLTKLKYDK